MKVYIDFKDNLISNEQAETFAYNIYRDIAEYLKDNFEDFFEWNLETICMNIVLTLYGMEIIKNNYQYNLCLYAVRGEK